MEPLELKIKRIQAGMTQFDLGWMTGIHPSRLSEMETGKRPIAEAVIEVLDRELADVALEQKR